MDSPEGHNRKAANFLSNQSFIKLQIEYSKTTAYHNSQTYTTLSR